MKKGLVIVLAVLLVLGLATTVALAGEPTEVNITWSGVGVDAGGYPIEHGVGYISATVTAGNDSVVNFRTFGASIAGLFTCIDNNDNPAYDVDTVSSSIDADVATGYIQYSATWDDSRYFDPPQTGIVSYNFVGTGTFTDSNTFLISDGDAEMKMGGTTNYGHQLDCDYPDKYDPVGAHFKADASDYTIIKKVTGPDGDSARVTVVGTGFARLNCYFSEIYKDQVKLGTGGGCGGYEKEQASLHAVGSGTFDVIGVGNNSVTYPWITDVNGNALTAVGDGNPGTASLEIISEFATGENDTTYDFANYAVVVQ